MNHLIPVLILLGLNPTTLLADRLKSTRHHGGDYIQRSLSHKETPTFGAKSVSYPVGADLKPVNMKLVRGAHPVIKVRVNGKHDLNLLVDTGATRTNLSANLFNQPHKTISNIQSLCFENDICYENIAISFKNSNYTQQGEQIYNGLLGNDLIQHFPLTLDYKKRKFYFYNTQENNRNKLTVSFTMDKSFRPFTKFTAGDQLYSDKLLDTGATYTRLTPAMEKASSLSLTKSYHEMAFSINRQTITEIFTIDRFCVETVCSNDMLVQIGNWPAVGATFFRNYLTTFDLDKEKLYLTAYPSNETKNANQLKGLQVSIQDPGLIVWVAVNSPASEAGLSYGDRIITANNKPVTQLGYFGINEMLEKQTNVSIEYLNTTGRTLTTTITE